MQQNVPNSSLLVRHPHGVAPDRTTRHYNQIDLARRWNISPRTLERWRWQGNGPRFLKIGGRVAYRLEDIEAFEHACRRNAGAKAIDPEFSTAEQHNAKDGRTTS